MTIGKSDVLGSVLDLVTVLCVRWLVGVLDHVARVHGAHFEIRLLHVRELVGAAVGEERGDGARGADGAGEHADGEILKPGGDGFDLGGGLEILETLSPKSEPGLGRRVPIAVGFDVHVVGRVDH